ncbi:porin family protein [Pedobacter sp. KR3-3]|uniref:Porin family protein n=1 Tax=Pedobacter albus TaxID=3113905 RepID=A0ABU7IBR1_9SPHI|nr:porin family protein [Pedobacter sp. KR3-3]MEE1946789.1 porin family protein [Pedobacter sp. KR3-3]
MKKNLLMLAVLLLALGQVNAQEQTKKLGFGFKAGLNISAFTNKQDMLMALSGVSYDSFENYFRISAMAGITATYKLNPKFALNAELLYNSRGTAYRRPNNSVLLIGDKGVEQAYDYYKFMIDYVELPLMVSYYVIPSSKPTALSVYLGLAPGIAVRKAAKMDYPEVTAGPGNGKADVNGELGFVNSFNASGLFGLKVGHKLENGTAFFIDLRGSYGMLPVFKKEVNIDTRMLTGTFALGLDF